MTDNEHPSQPDEPTGDSTARDAADGTSSEVPATSSPEAPAVDDAPKTGAHAAPEEPESQPDDATVQHAESTPTPQYIDDAPTGEVVTGPVRYTPDPTTQAYSQTEKPGTKQMDALDSSAFEPIPQTPPAVSTGPVKTAPVKAKKGGRRRTVALILAAVVLLVVIAGVGSELYIRNKVTDCLQASFQNLTGTDTDVSVSRRPMLLSVMDGNVPWVQIDTTSGGDTTMRLHARAEGISTDGGTVQTLNGNGFLPYDRIKELSKGDGTQPTGAPIESITADPSAGTLKIATTVTFAIIPVPATVTLKPVLKDGAVTFTVEDATALVFGVPKDFAQPIVDQVTTAMFGPLFKQIKVSKLDVAKNGIDFAFDGTDVNMKSAAESSGQTDSSGTCKV
ncbi:LmeA family phospholipid-binding protein [Gordonia phthalatica]|uniref:DUF2993 domain-containing protein n=1 Tax=Gordonia phthalatica TaxID=1136941 RepID=A0A0N9MNG7_9ACTN|nr:LmeA family phospholipid-binding protein [Gordonia phthalatica]ALG83619.1 hypothetical protein ACH46_02710 [Gordonia phthalatica]